MSTKRGQLNCSKDTRNTGFGSCFEDWKTIAGALVYDNPREFTDAELSDLQTLLQNEAAADVKANRMYPIHKFLTPTDNTEDVIIQTFDYGFKIPVRDGDNDWLFQFYDGGNCLSASLRTHNGPSNFLFYDKENKILGTRRNNKMATIPGILYAKPWGLATGSTVANYAVRFIFQSKYVNELREFIKADFDVADIQGLKDIQVVVDSWDQDTGIAEVTLQTMCGATNLYDQYSGDVVAGLLSAVDDDGNTVHITTLTAQSGSKNFSIHLNVGEIPDSGKITFTGAVPSAMATAGIPGYEIATFELEIEGS